ncbi:MAG: SDR family oxidoreductase [Deltaproteobacteria bacterium]|nr:SDR family oxidoreductase [Deltaproteobacteria bacterium]
MSDIFSRGRVLVLGATGYVGGRLVPRLLDAGWTVRAAARSRAKLGCRPWAGHQECEIAAADALNRESLDRAMADMDAVFYLVHSMAPGGHDYAERDRKAAENARAAAEQAGVKRIIYLGGLGAVGQGLSKHLRSRTEVGEILGSGPVPLTWLRAAMILGAGSASFEIMRYLVDRLPVMITPIWVHTRCQPIAISNVLDYLAGCLENEATAGETYDIGGPDILTYKEMFDIYARAAGLKPRLIIPVPVLTPTLSSYWIHLVTPIPAALAKPLAQGLGNEVVCQDNRIREAVPAPLVTVAEAIAWALDRVRQQTVETCWSDAGDLRPPEWVDCGDVSYAGGTVLEMAFTAVLDRPAAEVWPAVAGIGGEHGWYFADWLWNLRGLADRMLGGIGLRRGRRHPDKVQVGDALDFWRVLVVDVDQRLQLLAEMRLPGEAILDFRLEPVLARQTRVVLSARFLPRGLWGIIYWRSLHPVHVILFRGLLTGLARRAGAKIVQGPVRFQQKETTCTLRN